MSISTHSIQEIEILRQIDDSIKTKEHLRNQLEVILGIANEIINTFKNGGKVILFGNGGSAGDAQHIAAEFMGKFHLNRDPLPAIALTTNTSCLTAIGNDYGYEQVFERQVRAIAKAGDIVIGISTSGNSLNVILGIENAKKCGCKTVVFIGRSGKMANIADYVISFPSSDTPRIQEAHITAGHLICDIVEKTLFSKDTSEGI